MAAGDITLFRQFLLDLGTKKHDLSADTIKLGLVTASTVPSATTADPRWGSGGTTNFATNAVATATAYTGPLTLSSVTWTLVSNVPTLRGTAAQIAADASGFTNARYGIIYNDTDTGKRAIGFVDLGATVSIAAAAYTVDFNGATDDIFTLS